MVSRVSPSNASYANALLAAAARNSNASRLFHAPHATATPQKAAAASTRVAAPSAASTQLKRSGNPSTDALLAGGNDWWYTSKAKGSNPSAGARRELTFSFLTATPSDPTDAAGFVALDANQKSHIKAALSYVSSVVRLNFKEVSSGGDLQFGSNVQADSAAYAYYPNTPGGSRIMLARNQASFTANGGNWTPGTYEYQTILHEIGHALGLKHPGNYNAGGGGTPGPYLPSGQDHAGNTIMSYYGAPNARSVSYSGGAFSAATVNPESYQAFDIGALQYLYGAPVVAAKTYSWAAGAKFTGTIWNSNAGSRIDLSNQTLGSVVDLRAGKQSSIAVRDAYADMPFNAQQYAGLTTNVGGNNVTVASVLGTPTYTGRNNLTIAAGSRINGVTGGSGADTVITNADRNAVAAGGGNDSIFLSGTKATINGTTIDGGSGTDVLFVQKLNGFSWAVANNGSKLTLTQNSNRRVIAQIALTSIEQVKYWNGADLAAAAGGNVYGSPAQAAAAYQAAGQLAA